MGFLPPVFSFPGLFRHRRRPQRGSLPTFAEAGPMTSTHASNRPQAVCSALMILAVRRQTRVVAPSCRATWTSGHSVQSAQVGVAHMAAISHGEHEPHAHLSWPAFERHPLGLGLDCLQRSAIGKFQRAEVSGINLANTGKHVEQPREVGVAVGMQCQCLHIPTVQDQQSNSRTK